MIPAGIEVTVTRNYGETANDKAMKLIQKLAFATLSVVALVFVALGRREAVIVGAAVILTLAATLFASWAWGFTLNRVSLFALIFSIGILVDDAIVVVENIHRHRALEPDAPLASLIPKAVDEVGGPTIVATLTVIAALLPMAFVCGLMGPYMSPIPIHASMGMLISLAIAFTFTPWLALRLARAATPRRRTARRGSIPPWRAASRGCSHRFIDPRSGGRKRRWLLAASCSRSRCRCCSRVVQWVVLKMLPFDNKSEFQVVVDMPAGTPVENTAAVLHEMGAYLATVPEVTDFQGYAGTAAPINFNGLVRQYFLRQAPENGDLQVNLVGKHDRARKSHDIAPPCGPSSSASPRSTARRSKVVEVPPGPPVLAPLVAEVYGPDEAGRHAVAKRVRAEFARARAHRRHRRLDRGQRAEDRRPRRPGARRHARGGARRRSRDDARRARRRRRDDRCATGSRSTACRSRSRCRPERQGKLDTILAMRGAPATARSSRSPRSCTRSVERDRTIYHKDLLPVTYVVGDVAGGPDSPLYGMFAARGGLAGVALPQGGSARRVLDRAAVRSRIARLRSNGTASGR